MSQPATLHTAVRNGERLTAHTPEQLKRLQNQSDARARQRATLLRLSGGPGFGRAV